MKIAMVTNAVYDDLPDYVAMTDALKCRYCHVYGIEYVRMAANPHPEIRPEWQKISVLLGLVGKYDWLVWMDCDAAPLNIEFDLPGYLSSVEGHVVMRKDVNGWNAGVFAIPNDRRCIKWLKHVNSLRNEARYHVGFYEQQAMADTLDEVKWRDIVVEPPDEIGWNNYLDGIYGRTGDPNVFQQWHWTLHLPACNSGFRKDVFGRLVSAVVNAGERNG